MNLSEELRNYIKSLGLEIFGSIKLRKFEELVNVYETQKKLNILHPFTEGDWDKRIDPSLIFEGGKSIISIAFPYKTEENKSLSYFSRYTKSKDYHKVVKDFLNKICTFLISHGYSSSAYCDNNPLPEKYIASLCGIGYIGKNGLLINEKYGSYIFLGEIITSAEIEFNNQVNNMSCNNCTLCESKCPSNAISKYNDYNKCISYYTQKKDINFNETCHIKSHVFGCDICQYLCPKNRKIDNSNLRDFEQLDFFQNVNLYDILYMDKKHFENTFFNTACGFRGKNVLKRNALINIMFEENNFVPTIPLSDYLKKYYDLIKDNLFKEVDQND